MFVTLHIYVKVHCYCSAPIDPSFVHAYLKHLQSYKVMDINVKEINMATKCKLTIAKTNKHAHTYYMFGYMFKIWTSYNQNLYSVVQFTKWAKKFTYHTRSYNAYNTYNNYNATLTWKCDYLSSPLITTELKMFWGKQYAKIQWCLTREIYK